MKETRHNGIALLTVLALTVLLSLIAALMVRLSQAVRIRTSTATDQVSARLLARSGIEYAAGRLWLDPARHPAESADDWTFRDPLGTPLEQAKNPSYAITEPYTDKIANGRYDEGLDTYTDLNGNGRFDTWSGRLRSRYIAAGAVFKLRVSSDSAIDINQGTVSAADDNGNRIPDHRDPGLTAEWDPPFPVAPRNRRLADVVDELGRIVGCRRENVGRWIVQNRPLGGYQSRHQLQAVLGADWDLLGTLLDLSSFCGGDQLVNNYDAGPLTGGRRVWRPQISPTLADPAVLQAILRRLTFPVADCQPITVDEASALAAQIQGKGAFASWQKFSIWLYQAGKISVKDAVVRTNGSPYFNAMGSGFPRRWDLLFSVLDANLNPDNIDMTFFWPSFFPDGEAYDAFGFGPMSWWGYDHAVPFRHRKEEWVYTKAYPPVTADPRLSDFGDSPPPPDIVRFGTQELTLDPQAGGFALESVGLACSLKATLASSRAFGEIGLARSVVAASQADFENWNGPRIWSDDLQVVGRPQPDRDRMQTYPLFSADSSPGSHFVLPAFWSGTIRLMDRSDALKGDEVLYHPCWEKGQPMREPKGVLSYDENFWDVSPSGLSSVPGLFFGAGGSYPAGANGIQYGFTAATKDRHPLVTDSTVSEGTIEFISTHPWAWILYPPSPPNAGKGTGLGTVTAPDVPTLRDLTSPPDPGDVVVKVPVLSRYYGNFMTAWGHAGSVYDFIEGGLFDRVDTVSQTSGKTSTRDTAARAAWKWSGGDDLLSIRSVPPVDFHQLIFSFGPGGVQGFIDGIPDPGLAASSFQSFVISPQVDGVGLGFMMSDDARLYKTAKSAAYALARSQESRFWTSDPSGATGSDKPPSFTSPLYRFENSRTLTGCRWDGYVPKRIREAAGDFDLETGYSSDLSNSQAFMEAVHQASSAVNSGVPPPLRVKLLYYRNPEGTGDPVEVALPEQFWKQGGGWKALDIPGVHAFRYKVEMDASAIDTGYNNETPIFDSISVSYRRSAPRVNVSEE